MFEVTIVTALWVYLIQFPVIEMIKVVKKF